MKRIIKIEIQNSEFYENDFEVDFSNNLNCLMGGRGTGKSTILHFIKSCIELDAEEDKNTFNVLRNNLGAGIIRLFLEADNGENYKIEKSFGESPQPYLLSTGRHIALENISKDILCDIFPAQMIEEIGRNSEARLALIDKMLAGEIEDLQENIELLKIDLEKNSKDIRSHNQKLNRANEKVKEYQTAEEDLKTHKAEPHEDIKEDEKIEFDKQDKAEKIRGAERRFLNNLLEKLTLHLERYNEINEEIQDSKTFISNIDKFINTSILSPLTKEIDENIAKVLDNNEGNKKLLEYSINKVKISIEKIKDLHEQQHNIFIQLKQKLDKHKVYFDKLNVLYRRVDDKNIIQKDIEEIIQKRKKLKQQRDKGIVELNKIKKVILEKRLEKILELNRLFEGRIKITLTPNGITEEYENALRNALKGHNMRYNVIIPYIVNSFSPDRFAKIIHDKDTETLKNISSIDIERSQAVMDALYETEAIYEIETIYCPDLPDFHLKVDKSIDKNVTSKENYKKSDELSTGQRCTTVLPIVFAISKNPLIIDQPEDNLDNEYISTNIDKIISEQKMKRQLIFITHNANIPVLGEAEKNVFLNYSDKKSKISHKGTVDDVKDNILLLLEGGEEAFKQRMKLYKY